MEEIEEEDIFVRVREIEKKIIKLDKQIDWFEKFLEGIMPLLTKEE